MSNLDLQPREAVCGGLAGALEPVVELLPGAAVALGGPRGMHVTRTLPNKGRRMVGAWCFVDHYGPEVLTDGAGMRIPPHPHTGLQTVSWLLQGEVLHRDSLGSLQLIRPGELNLMTAGRAIAHSEETPALHGDTLHGVQLWVALPAADREADPHFEHHGDLPVVSMAGATVTVLMGTLGGARSSARTYSPILGAEVHLDGSAAEPAVRLPVRADFEHAVLVLSGVVEVEGTTLRSGPLLYLGGGRASIGMRAGGAPATVLLLGGVPFEEQIVMWWNFVARSHDEIVQARERWMSGREFGVVNGFDGAPLPAPPMPVSTLRPRGRR